MKIFDFVVSLGIYSLDAVKFASYTFTDNGFVKIEKQDENNVLVSIETDKDPKIVEKLFFNELLHHSLRLKISDRNSKIRERIVIQALVSAVRTPVGASECNSKEKHNINQTDDASKEIADKALEEEINKLLKEAEEGSYKEDPLNIAIPWEEKNK